MYVEILTLYVIWQTLGKLKNEQARRALYNEKIKILKQNIR